MLSSSYLELQDFYILKYETEKYPVALINNIKYIWEMNKDMWFSHEEMFEFPMINTMYENNININMSIILHYDQIYRHPNKRMYEPNKKYAFSFATTIALKMLHSKDFSKMKDWEKVFTLLALRHNKSLKMKTLVLKKTYTLLEDEPTNSLYLRFLNATIMDIHNFKQSFGYSDYKEGKDIDMMEISETILERPQLKETILSRTHQKYPIYLEEKLKNAYKETILKIDTNKYAVSISGGVDSMVLSYIMSKVCKYLKKELILLHICYNNRDCCTKELELLCIWAKRLNVKLYVREIDEIKRSRNTSFRALYEDVTRKIRFSFYRYFNCPILLGHNKDDCLENVFSNLSKKIHYDNLFGMSDLSKESNIDIMRPMLNITKQEIYDYADLNDIPHLYDSTPVWSNRGKMRDILIPQINSFNKDIVPGLYDYIRYTTFLESQWKMTFSNWLNNIKELNNYNKKKINIEMDTYFLTNFKSLNFWVQLWFGLDLETRPGNKSFSNLIEKISQYKQMKNHKRNCTLNKRFKIQLDNKLLTIIDLV